MTTRIAKRTWMVASAVAALFLQQAYANEAPKADAHGAEAPKAESHGGGEAPAAEGATPSTKSRKPDVDCKANRKDGGNICARIIPAPAIEMEPVPPNKNTAWVYTDYRYSIILLFSSWNRRSEDLARIARPFIDEFKRRRVGLLGFASHDQQTELQKWQDAVRPPFPIGIAPLEVIMREKNPKLPTVWIANSNGELVTKLTLPSDEEFKSILDKIIQWTEF